MRTRLAASAALIGLSVAATIAIVSGAPAGAAAPSAAAVAAPVWKTEFRDDFSGTGLPNSANWLLTLGTAYPGGPANFGTGEIQTMTNDRQNVDVRNGNLYITPQRDSAGAWTSARVETARSNFKPPAGGVMRVESRLQMPNVTGTAALGYWPAFWMLGGPYRADRWSWPRVGEFDIMENVNGLNWTYNVLHCGVWAGGPCNETDGINNGVDNAGAPCVVTTCQAGFHTYGFEWDTSGASDQLRWTLDGKVTFTVNEGQLPATTWTEISSHMGYFVILNVAMGGAFPSKAGLGGGPTAATKPGVPMVVDYVQVLYSGQGGSPTATPTATPTVKPTVVTPTVVTPTVKPTVVTPTVVTPTQPVAGAPSNLRVTSSTASSITVGWDGPAAAKYDVLRSGQRIATVTGNRFTDLGLLPNTPYLYSISGGGVTTPVITARIGDKPAGSSTPAPTPPVTVTPTPTAPAGAGPSNLRVTGTTASTITIGWDGPVSASYEVLRSGIRINTVTTRSFTDIGLFRNTPYEYSIRAGGVTTPVLTARIP
ncbi:family 16 glycosylhydrolase [Nakamurella sp. GG22]